MTNPPQTTCASCGNTFTGQFCSQCGARAGQRRCEGCGGNLTPGARYCHLCGAESGRGVGARKERFAWVVAGLVALLSVAAVAYSVGKGNVPTPQIPAMANAGSSGGSAIAPATRAPDISNLTPRQRFDRLFERVMRAAEARSADTVMMFAPMALDAYGLLAAAEVDADARYHAAMIHTVVGEFARAKAKADSILAGQPDHLFGYLIRGEVAEYENDSAALATNYANFLRAYDAEMAANRVEYLDHQAVITDFRNRAQANRR